MAFQKNQKTQKNQQAAQEKKRDFVSLANANGGATYIWDGDMWLRSGKYPAPSVSVPVDDKSTLSDWMRHVKLEDVTLIVRVNDNGYPELTIRGGDCSDTPF